VDEEGLEHRNRESQIVSNGILRLYTQGLERKIQQQNPLTSKSKSCP